MKSGQTALEFLITFAVLGLIFVVFSVYIADQFVFFYSVTASNDDTKQIASIVASEIDRAYVMGEGYSHNFTLPEGAAGKDYSIVHNSTHKIIEVYLTDNQDRFGSSRYIAENVTIKDVGPGENVVYVSKEGVVVYGSH
ncbi:MAG: hypothetical protein J7K68_02415 [Candidatus Diapherotrites archaeon]|nr:hypothetical protein [Candidatus Diapherotrites archaeon]